MMTKVKFAVVEKILFKFSVEECVFDIKFRLRDFHSVYTNKDNNKRKNMISLRVELVVVGK